MILISSIWVYHTCPRPFIVNFHMKVIKVIELLHVYTHIYKSANNPTIKTALIKL